MIYCVIKASLSHYLSQKSY